MAKRTFSHWVIRFWRYVEFDDDGCWEWAGPMNPNGYGAFTIGRRPGRKNPVTGQPHRIAYELVCGPVPVGLELDHLCRNRRCVRPDHLEAVTHTENMARAEMCSGPDHPHGGKTHCPQGHAYDEANTYHNGGRRYCRTCVRAATRKWKSRKIAA